MSEYRIKPTVLAGYTAFKLERLGRLWPMGHMWMHVAYCTSRKEAEKTIIHLDGPIVSVVTEGKEAARK